ncbi:MAG: DUF5666 domain-containing protein, partial [Rhodothermales bacterium]
MNPLVTTRSIRSLLLITATLLAATPAFAQQRLMLSSSADFSTQDHLFADGETIYIQVVPGARLDLAAVTESKFKIDPVRDGEEFEGTLAIQVDGSFTGSVDVSDLMGSSAAWHVKVEIEDAFDHEFEARTAIAIRGRAEHPETFRVHGTVEAASDVEITVAGLSIVVSDETEIHGDVESTEDLVGRSVTAVVRRSRGGLPTALQIIVHHDARGQISVSGLIEAIGLETVTVDGVEFHVTAGTEIKNEDGELLLLADLGVGTFVRVRGQHTADGWVATSIRIGDRDDDDEEDEQEVEGVVEAVGDASIHVAGIDFTVNEETEFDGAEGLEDIAVGSRVEIEYVVLEDGVHLATKIEVEDDDEGDDDGDDDGDDEEEVEVEGTIIAISDHSITVGEVEFVVTSETEIEGAHGVELSFADLHTGMNVEVKGFVRGDGAVEAVEIEVEDEERAQVSIRGEILSVADSSVTIGETTFSVTEDTQIRGEHGTELTLGDLEIGMFARAQLVMNADGSLTAIRMKVERRFEREDVEVTGHIEELTATEITVHGLTFTVTDDTEIEGRGDEDLSLSDLQVGMIAHVEGGYDDGGVLFASEIKIRGRVHHEGRISGLVTATGDSLLEVDNVAFTVTDETIFSGASSLADIAVGQRVRVHFRELGDGSRVALRVGVKTELDHETELTGAIESIEGDSVVVAGVTVLVTAATTIEDNEGNTIALADLEVGQTVEVEGAAAGDVIVARKIKVEDSVVISGSVSSQSSSLVSVSGNEFAISEETLIVGAGNVELSVADLSAGVFVEVLAVGREGDGSSSTMTAERVTVMQ